MAHHLAATTGGAAATKRAVERAGSGLARWAASIMQRRFEAWSPPGLRVELPDGRTMRHGDGAHSPLLLRIRDWRFFARAVFGGDIGLGESYTAGEWECSDLAELLRLFLLDRSLLDRPSPLSWGLRAANRLRSATSANTRAADRRNIGLHYDLGNEFFALFLDPSLTYSSAIFARPETSLAEAQREKLDGICRRLDLRADHHVLEIGSGWGSFALHAAATYGCRVTSLTLSAEQLRLARERASRAGLADRIDFQLRDYRDARGSFDHVVSIEMIEAVGYGNLGAFFRACDGVLRPGGRILLQTITVPDWRFDAYRKQFDWVRTYIFPGGCLTSIGAIAAALKAETGLRIEWLRDIAPHYARTLRDWRERFLAALPEVRGLGFDERFVRTWELYLAGCEAAFAASYIGVAQMLLGRPLETRPLTA